MNYSKIKKITENCGIKTPVFDINTSKLCSIGAGGKAAALMTVDSAESLLKVMTYLEKEKIDYIIIGGGTNIVFTGDHTDLVIIKLGKLLGGISIDNEGKIKAGASLNMPVLVKKAADRGLDLAFMAGIPGTVGGGILGNSGSSGKWIYDAICEVEYIRRIHTGFEVSRCGKSDISAGYRFLNIPDMAALISVVLKPEKADRKELALKIRQDTRMRKETQPVGKKTSGCFFKNPGNGKEPAGALIDECGLKGFSYGGARVSPVHANFIENFKSASPEDIVVLSRIMIDKVRERFGISLEYEVKLMG
jgi:UDP-N-acetylmuramate dehydrogenase